MKIRWLVTTGLAASILAACASSDNELDEMALDGWLDAYGAAWEKKDPSAVAALFTEDARYRETPYAEPFEGRDAIADYWTTVTEDQADIDFSYEAIAISGNTGIAQWSSQFRSISGDVPVELNGVFVLEFDEQAIVSSLREWWHVR